MDTGPGIQRIEEQLDDLLSMLGCPDRDKRPAAPPAMSPLDRLVRTQPIWHCPEVTREEAVTLLHNKKEGNFLVRGSRQPGTLALSVRLSPSPELELASVQHFIILARGGGRVALEDSDLVFDNIVSLAFHYTQVCDELPSRLSLPAVLATATSTQNLASLALLGKSFWSYPMAACSRASVCGDTGDMETMASNNNNKNNNNGGPLTRTPPRPPNRTRSSSQPQAQAGGGGGVPRSRRNSDSAPFIMSVARVQPTRPARHSLGSLYPAAEWVSSPVWASSGRHSPPAPAARSRKVSVFYNKLGHVSEAGEPEDTREEGEECSSDLAGDSEEEADYAFPLDAVTEENSEHSIYENPHSSSSQADTRTDIVMEPLSPLEESDEGGDTESSHGDTFSQSHNNNSRNNSSSHSSNSNNTGSSERRKLSLGVILRKLSSGSQHQPAAAAKERKTSLQEKRLSTAISKLITPIFERRSLGMSESYQVNSSSWEFLNQEPQDKVQDKVQEVQDKVQEVQGKVLGKHPSTDSLYESEFESSSTLESATSTHSRLLTSALQQC